jgi:peptide/nickel transport system ATP-binding protein
MAVVADPEDLADALLSGTVDEAGIELSAEAPLLAITDLSVDFPTVDGVVHAVRGLTFSLRPREVLAVVGESGSGKSVTALAIMGLLPKTARVSGSIRYRGVELIGMPDKQMAKLRGLEIAMVFQDPMTSLNPVYRVGSQLAEAILAHHDIPKKEAQRRAADLLALVGIPHASERARNYPHEFSGGMRQRAVIAMAIANNPDVIIADEPTTALDVTVQAQILETVEKAQEATSAAMILITHDLGIVAGVADRVVVMYAGKAVETGTVDDVFYRPRMPYTVGLLGALPSLDAGGDEQLIPVPGAPPSLLNLPAGCPFSPRCPLVVAACHEVEPKLEPIEPGHQAACLRHLEVPALANARIGHRIHREHEPFAPPVAARGAPQGAGSNQGGAPQGAGSKQGGTET